MRNLKPIPFCHKCQAHHKKLFHFKKKWKSKFSRGNIIACNYDYATREYTVPKLNSLYEIVGTYEYRHDVSGFVVIQSIDEADKLIYTMWDQNHFKYAYRNKFHLKLISWLTDKIGSYIYYISKIHKLK